MVVLDATPDPVFDARGLGKSIHDIYRPPVPEKDAVEDAIDLVLQKYGDFSFKPNAMEILHRYTWDDKECMFIKASVDWQALAEDLVKIMPAIDYDFDQTLEVSCEGFDFMNTELLDLKKKNKGSVSEYVKQLKEEKRNSLENRLNATGDSTIPENLAQLTAAGAHSWVRSMDDLAQEGANAKRIIDQYERIREGYSIKVEGFVNVVARDYFTDPRFQRIQIIRETEQKCHQNGEEYAGVIEARTRAVLSNNADYIPPSKRDKHMCQKWGVVDESFHDAESLASKWVSFHEGHKNEFDTFVREANTATGGRIGWALDEEWRYYTPRTCFPSTPGATTAALNTSAAFRSLYMEPSGGPPPS